MPEITRKQTTEDKGESLPKQATEGKDAMGSKQATEGMLMDGTLPKQTEDSPARQGEIGSYAKPQGKDEDGVEAGPQVPETPHTRATEDKDETAQASTGMTADSPGPKAESTPKQTTEEQTTEEQTTEEQTTEDSQHPKGARGEGREVQLVLGTDASVGG